MSNVVGGGVVINDDVDDGEIASGQTQGEGGGDREIGRLGGENLINMCKVVVDGECC